MATSLIVKAFLERNGDPKAEVRRFGVNQESVKYDRLIMRLAEIFPSLEVGSFRVSWKDNDGDSISFSSDAELTEAMNCVTDGVFRIYLKEINLGGSGSDSGGELHPMVVCDGCEGQIRGIRYKCTMCEDYDLCSECEGKGMHQQHDMLKIRVPKRRPNMVNFPPHIRQWLRRCRKGGKMFGPGCPPPPFPESQFLPARPPPPPGPHGPHGPCPPGPPGPPGPPPAPGQDHNEFLRTVGQNIASCLNPFGIDVTYEVRPPCPFDPQMRRGHGHCWRRGNGMCRRTDRARRQQQQQEEESKPEGEEGANQPQTTPQTAEDKPQTAEDTAGKSMDSESSNPEDEELDEGRDIMGDWDVLRECIGDLDKEEEKPDTARKDPDDTTPVTARPQPAPATAPVTTAPPQPTPAQAPLHPNPKVAKSLQIMLNMGFDNEHGWLARLLQSKDGDILQVLEAIHPETGGSHPYGGQHA